MPSPLLRVSLLVAGITALALVLSGCSLLPASPAGPGGAAAAPSATSAALAPYYEQTPAWVACGTGMLCASIHAPISWQHPDTTFTTLALIKSPATGTRRGSLVINPGGPGEPGVSFIRDGVENAVDESVRAHYDVVGFDPRGVGDSTQVSCLTPAELDKYLYGIVPGVIGSAAWISASEATATAFAAACQKKTGKLLGHVDSVSVTRDLDLIRAVLGDTKLNYLGYSYGTYIGALYAGLYPRNVGRFVLDGAMDPWDKSDSTSAASDTSQPEAFEGDLREYLKSCLAGYVEATGDDGACAFRGTVSSAMKAISALLAQVAATPLPNADGRQLGAATLALAITEALYDPSSWPALNDMFVAVKKGEAAPAFALADEYNGRNADGSYANNSVESNIAINCLDGGAKSTNSEMKDEAQDLRKAAPVLGMYNSFTEITCNLWPYKPVAFPDAPTASGSGPILVVGTTGDPATPYADAQNLAALLNDGHLLTYVGQGHTAYNRGSTCVDAVVDDYLIKGTTPASDPRCH